MLPGLSTVLRRDKERQRASALTQSGASTGSIGDTSAEETGMYMSNVPQSPNSSGNNVRRNIGPPQLIAGTSNSSSISQSPPQGIRMPSGLLPEEHRARERERERLARAQLSNAHTGQMMANRQIQQEMNASSQNGDTQQARYSSSHMESSVTRLLVATKMLLEALTKWSLGQRTESQVSDIYVRLGNDFNVANVAFGSYGIDMSDLTSVPDDLRDCLERCLSEDASPQTLEIHLPRIREIIIGLLQGLKSKQAEYKQLVMQRRASARSSKIKTERGAIVDSSTISSTIPEGSRLSSANGGEVVQRDGMGRSPTGAGATLFGDDVRKSISGKRPINAPPITEESAASIQRPTSASSSRQSDQVRPPHRRSKRETGESRTDNTDVSSIRSPQSVATSNLFTEKDSTEAALGLVADNTQNNVSRSQTSNSLNGDTSHNVDDSRTALNEIGDAADPSVRALKSRDALERRASKRFSAYTFNKMGVGLNQGLGMSSYGLSGPGSAMSSPVAERVTVNTPSRGSVKRTGMTRSSSELQTADTPTKGPPRERSALASETITENVDLPSRKKGSRTSPRHSPKINQHALAPPLPMLKDQSNSSTESLPFVDAQSPQKEPIELDNISERHPSSPIKIPPVPPLPSLQEQARLDAAHGVKSANHRNVSGSRTPTASSWNAKQANSMSLYLQLGRQTKKVNVDLDPTAPFKGLSTGKLRMLFMDKFSYSPGKEDFPTIYVKDGHSGVTYELEDLSELTDGTVLTLNIEPLDQVKQHLDLTLGSITRELRDLKTAMQDRDREWGRRISAHPHDGLSPQISMAPRISDAQFAKAGARVAQYKRATMFFGREQPEGEEGQEDKEIEDKSKDLEGSTPVSPTDNNIPSVVNRPTSVAWQMAGDQLKKQYDEVLNVRRQLAVMVQIQDDFKSDVGGLLGTLREQAKRVRTIAAMEVPTERNFIITGKARLDSNSQEVLTLVEDLLDLVDDLKSDVIQRGVKPKPNAMKKLSEDIDRATRGLDELSKYVDLVKPSWKKTWEMELQNIVDEQEFLNHQEGLIADLKEDHANLQDVFHNIQEVVKLRGANKFNLLGTGSSNENALSNISLRTYIPPPLEEGHEGLSTVMLEVKSQRPDHEKRLKALEAAEKQRLKENHQRKTQEDEFQTELTTFVDGKALRKTGGYMETERIRGKRDKMTLNAMFGAGGVGGAPISDAVKPPPRKLVVGGKSSGGTSDNGSKEALTPTAGYSSTGSYSGELLGETSTPPETFSDEVPEN